MRTLLGASLVGASMTLIGISMTEALADCDQSSLDGSYAYSAIDTVKFDDIVVRSFTELCIFEINEDGVIETADDPLGICFPDEFEGFSFLVNDDCSILLLSANCRYDGQLSRDRNVAAGSGICGAAPDLVFDVYFSLIRR